MKPQHYHQLDHPSATVTIRLGGEVLARSNRTIQLKEVGRRIYDPVFYFPPEDVVQECLNPTTTRTMCPIKGEASYWAYTGPGGTREDLVWGYGDPIEYSESIRGYLAFDSRVVTVEIDPGIA